MVSIPQAVSTVATFIFIYDEEEKVMKKFQYRKR